MPLDHLSYSSISAYLSCGRNWQFKYVEQVSTPTTPELVFGTAFHHTVEQYIATRQPLLQLWGACWHKATEGTDVEWGTETPEELLNDGLRILSDETVQRRLLSIVPLCDDAGPRIERRVELRVPGVPMPVVGYIDLITSDCVPGDIKTSKYAWTQDRAEKELQPVFYLAALNQAGFHAHGWRFRHYIFTKTKVPQVQVIEHQHSAREVFWLFKVVKTVYDAIESQTFLLNPGGWQCTPKYCAYWNLCRGREA